MRISYGEPVLNEYSITEIVNTSDMFGINAPLILYKTENNYELTITYLWTWFGDCKNINGIWDFDNKFVETTYTHKFADFPTEYDIKLQAEKDIQSIKNKWINKPYKCKNCQLCRSYKKVSDIDKYYYCDCAVIGLTRDGGKYKFQHCSEYVPIDKEK